MFKLSKLRSERYIKTLVIIIFTTNIYNTKIFAQACDPNDLAQATRLLDPTLNARIDTAINESTSVIWYPGQKKMPVTHLELAAGEKVVNTSKVYKVKNRSYSEIVDWAENGDGVGFFKFQFKTTPEETKRAQEIMMSRAGNPERWEQSCSNGVCSILRDAGIMNVPRPVAQSPLLTAGYLSVAKYFPGSKVQSVEFIGQKSLPLIAKSVGGETAMMTYLGGGTAIIVYKIVTPDGKERKVAIPVNDKK